MKELYKKNLAALEKTFAGFAITDPQELARKKAEMMAKPLGRTNRTEKDQASLNEQLYEAAKQNNYELVGILLSEGAKVAPEYKYSLSLIPGTPILRRH